MQQSTGAENVLQDMHPSFIGFSHELSYALIKNHQTLPQIFLAYVNEWQSATAVTSSQLRRNGSTDLLHELQVGAGGRQSVQMLVREEQGWRVNATWQARLDRHCESVLERVDPVTFKSTEERLLLFNAVFNNDRMGSGKVFSGSFSTDGYSLCMATIDIRKVATPKPFLDYLTANGRTNADTFERTRLQGARAYGASSFATFRKRQVFVNRLAEPYRKRYRSAELGISYEHEDPRDLERLKNLYKRQRNLSASIDVPVASVDLARRACRRKGRS